MIAQVESVAGLRDAAGKRLAVLWRITRTDGTVHRLTDHDASLTFGGEVYSPAEGFSASARRHQDALREATLELRGAVGTVFTGDDLRAYRFADAQVIEAIVDWRFPWRGAYSSHYWWIGQVTFDSESWTAELFGPERFLRRPIGSTVTRNCRHKLGDSLCGVNLSSFTTLAAVATGTDDGDRTTVVLFGGLGSFADQYFAGGEIRCVTGANVGIARAIRSSIGAGGRIALQVPFPFPVAVGDTFDLEAGCDKTFTTCRAKFTNGPKFGGFPYVPGSDRVLQTPAR